MQYTFPTSKATFLWRGLTHGCPRCGCRKTHTKYFSIKSNCPKCDLKFEKESGYWAGSLAINFILTGGIVMITLATSLILTAPDVPVALLLSMLLPLGIILPIVSYPFAHTTWMAIDYGFLSLLDK